MRCFDLVLLFSSVVSPFSLFLLPAMKRGRREPDAKRQKRSEEEEEDKVVDQEDDDEDEEQERTEGEEDVDEDPLCVGPAKEATEEEANSLFDEFVNTSFFSADSTASLHDRFSSNTPFPHLQLNNFLNASFLETVRDEIAQLV